MRGSDRTIARFRQSRPDVLLARRSHVDRRRRCAPPRRRTRRSHFQPGHGILPSTPLSTSGRSPTTCIDIVSRCMPEPSAPAVAVVDGARHPDSVTDMRESAVGARRREPSEELVGDDPNWEAIGGRSPLTAITSSKARRFRVFSTRRPDALVVTGMRNWRPFIADAMRRIERRCAASSAFPCAAVLHAQRAEMRGLRSVALPRAEPPACGAPRSSSADRAFAEMVRAAAPPPARMIFTAHSLPERVARSGPLCRRRAATAAGRAAVRPRQLSAGVSERGRTPSRGWARPPGQDSRADTRRRGRSSWS